MEKNNEIKNVMVETYAEDMAKVLEDDKSGLVKKIIHEEEEHERAKRNLSPQSKKNQLFTILSFVFIIASLGILFYFFLKKQAPVVPIERQFAPIIFTDKNTLVEIGGLKKDPIEAKVWTAVGATSVKSGGLEGIYLTLNKSSVGLKQFIELINGNFIYDESNFLNENFLMGVVNTTTEPLSMTGRDFFVLLKVRSTTDIFNAMRAWEEKMFSDLHGFFGFEISTETKSLLNENFQDGIIQNKNARILYDANKKIVMMYIFADDDSVIITNTEDAAKEIMLRLAASRVKK